MSNSDRLPFQEEQGMLAVAIRHPEQSVKDQYPQQRLAIYQSLFFNNILTLISGIFPVAKETVGDDRWQQLIRSFIANHRARTPLFLELGQEFLEFLQSDHSEKDTLPAYFLSLCHYEWVEVAVDIATETTPEHSSEIQDAWSTPLRLSPVAVLLSYPYPVHEISVENVQPEPKDTFLAVFRNASLEVRFIELGASSFQLLSLFQANDSKSAKELVCHFIKAVGLPESALAQGEAQIVRWFEIGLLY